MIDQAADVNELHLPGIRDHLTSGRTRAALKIQHHALTAVRQFLAGEGFIELLAPIIGPVTDPGVRGAKQIDVDYYGHRYKMMTSAILYKQASLLAHDKIFYVAPNVRLEPPETALTRRHLVEFHQIDVEVGGASRDAVMDLAERMVVHAVGAVLDELPETLDSLERNREGLKGLLTEPFNRVSHAHAIQQLNEIHAGHSADAEIDWRGEELLSLEAARPFFVTDYPKGSRGFYDRESEEVPGTLRNFDLIAAEGYGELCSGGEREFQYQRLIARIRETGENPAKYRWYLDLARDGLPDSAGFGLGVERLVRYIAGLEAVWQGSAFPKLAGVAAP
jgi:asparaginyl-tRNA synthetase